MVVFNRFTTLLSADLHAILDKIEDPLASLKFAVREMECALGDGNRNLQTRRRGIEMLHRQRIECAEEIARLQQQLDACFESNEDTLAKTVLRSKLIKEKHQLSLDKALSENEQLVQEEEKALRENELRLSAMREKLTLLTQQRDIQVEKEWSFDCSDRELSNEEVEVAFLQEKQRRAN